MVSLNISTTSLPSWVSLLVDQRVPEGMRKFYSQLQFICSVSRASTFSVLTFIEIVIFGVYSSSLLASVCIGTFVISLFNSCSYSVWLRITDDGSVLEMRIWSILLGLFSYLKKPCPSTQYLVRFLQNNCPKHIFRFSRGGGGFNLNISSSLYFRFVIKFWLLLSICGLHFLCPLNLKMLPTPLTLSYGTRYYQGDAETGSQHKKMMTESRTSELPLSQSKESSKYLNDPGKRRGHTEAHSGIYIWQFVNNSHSRSLLSLMERPKATHAFGVSCLFLDVGANG